MPRLSTPEGIRRIADEFAAGSTDRRRVTLALACARRHDGGTSRSGRKHAGCRLLDVLIVCENEVGMSPEEVVRQFCALVSKRDVEALRPLLADEVVYHNIGMPASRGIEATLANVAGQWQMFSDTYEYEIRNIAADGDIVLTERIDTVCPPGVAAAPVPVMGVFQVRNGEIVAWRDYFDPGLAQKLLAGEDAADLIS
jgi:limonene-1,2-epoxide hydrolase